MLSKHTIMWQKSPVCLTDSDQCLHIEYFTVNEEQKGTNKVVICSFVVFCSLANRNSICLPISD